MTERAIAWVHRGGPQAASYRYRTAIPAEQVAKINGYSCTINEGAGHVIVFSKPMPPDLDLAKQAKAAGAKVVVDIADDHLMHPKIGPLYREMAHVADAVVCPSDEMASRIHAATGICAKATIADPYEMPETAPHAEGDRVIWFGHSIGLPDLDAIRKSLTTWDLHVITGPRVPEGARQWSPEVMREEMALANLTVIPTRTGGEYKTNNRLLNAIRGGVFPVVGYHPSHKEFKSVCWVGNVPTGLRWARAHRSELNALVAAAQDYIRERYSPQALGAKWADFLGAV